MTPAISNTLPDPGPSTASPGFFDWNTRIGRAHFVLFSSIGVLPVILTMIVQADRQPDSAALAILANVISIVVGLLAAYRRLGDLDRSPWLTVVFVIPLVNGIMFFWLAFSRGSDKPTWCGEPPAPHGGGLTAVAIGAYLFLCAGLIYALMLTVAAAHPH